MDPKKQSDKQTNDWTNKQTAKKKPVVASGWIAYAGNVLVGYPISAKVYDVLPCEIWCCESLP